MRKGFRVPWPRLDLYKRKRQKLLKLDACSLKPIALSAALFEAARIYFDLHGAGQLFGPARLEKPCAEGLGVGGGATCAEANGCDRREVTVQQTGEEPGEIGVAAPYRRDGFHPGRTRRDGAVLGGEVGDALGGGDARVRGPEFDEPGEAERRISFLDKVESDDALGLVLVRAYERGVRFERGPQHGRRRVDHRVDPTLSGASQ